MSFQISKDLNDALEALLKKLPLETVSNLWDAWRTEAHRSASVSELPIVNENAKAPEITD
jgi:hypothetical protein